jgi:hypothetical protein
MTRFRIAFLAALGALVVVSAAGAMAIPRLNGTVTSAFTIGLKNAKGLKVTTLKRGKYTFVVKDTATTHNFTLDGPGFEDKVISPTAFTGTKTVTLTLKKGSYKFYCTIHPTLKGNFKVVA